MWPQSCRPASLTHPLALGQSPPWVRRDWWLATYDGTGVGPKHLIQAPPHTWQSEEDSTGELRLDLGQANLWSGFSERRARSHASGSTAASIPTTSPTTIGRLEFKHDPNCFHSLLSFRLDFCSLYSAAISSSRFHQLTLCCSRTISFFLFIFLVRLLIKKINFKYD